MAMTKPLSFPNTPLVDESTGCRFREYMNHPLMIGITRRALVVKLQAPDHELVELPFAAFTSQ
jgi:hypothetical protein